MPDFYSGCAIGISGRLTEGLLLWRSQADLNPKNPVDWRILLEILCWAHFGEKGKTGKTVYWTDERYCELLRDIHETKKKHAITKDASALRKLLELKGRKYRGVSFGRLKKALGEARSQHYNGSLAKVTYEAGIAEIDARTNEGKSHYTKAEYAALLRKFSRREADRIGSEPRPKMPK